jgi:hypothetical protein
VVSSAKSENYAGLTTPVCAEKGAFGLLIDRASTLLCEGGNVSVTILCPGD